MGLLAGVLPDLVGGIFKVLDRVIPDEKAREEAKRLLLAQEGQQALQEMQISLSAILAEAQSPDPWTSRARPSFLYIMYLLFVLCMVGGIAGIWFPGEVFQASENISRLFKALPSDLYWLFGAGFLGYTGSRTFEKVKGAAK